MSSGSDQHSPGGDNTRLLSWASSDNSYILGAGGSDQFEKKKRRRRKGKRRQYSSEKTRQYNREYYKNVVKPARQRTKSYHNLPSWKVYHAFQRAEKKWVALFSRYQEKTNSAPSSASPPLTTMAGNNNPPWWNGSGGQNAQLSSTLCPDGECARFSALIAPPPPSQPRRLFDAVTTSANGGGHPTTTTMTSSGLAPNQQATAMHIGLVAAAAKHYEVSPHPIHWIIHLSSRSFVTDYYHVHSLTHSFIYPASHSLNHSFIHSTV